MKFSYGIVLSILLIVNSCSHSTINKSETEYAISDTSQIDSIVIKNNDTLVLLKQNGTWIVNGAYNADEVAITRLFNTIRLIQMNSPLPENAIDIVSKNIKEEVLVEIYIKNKLQKSYYVGKYIAGSGNYYMLFDAKKPYIAHIPSYDFDLRTNFSTDVKKWQSTTLFSLSSNQINELYVKNNENESEFLLKNNGNEFVLYKNKLLYEFNSVSQDKILYYLSRYENVEIDKFFYDVDTQAIDSLNSLEPLFEISIIKTNFTTINFKAYYLIFNGKQDNDKFLGLIDNKELTLAKFYNFDLLIKDYNYFLE